MCTTQLAAAAMLAVQQQLHTACITKTNAADAIIVSVRAAAAAMLPHRFS
jgi:hypothetical protein